MSRILSVAVERGVGLEINTSDLRQASYETSPAALLVEQYGQQSGQILTIGSGARQPDQVGAGVSDGLEVARRTGFREVCPFSGREPRRLQV